MKVLEKKMDKVVIELTSEEIGRLGFDKIWDDIRLIYPASKFEVDHIDEIFCTPITSCSSFC